MYTVTRHLSYDIAGGYSNIGVCYLGILVYIIFGSRNGFFILEETFNAVLPGFYTVHHGNFVQFMCRHNHHYAYEKYHHDSDSSH